MKKIYKQIQIPLAIALFFFAAGLVFAADCSDMVKCAVCGKEMKKADAKITYVYKEKTYYFASEKCKEAFVKEPEKFLQAKC
jgi:YHS domain-containing protein